MLGDDKASDQDEESIARTAVKLWFLWFPAEHVLTTTAITAARSSNLSCFSSALHSS